MSEEALSIENLTVGYSKPLCPPLNLRIPRGSSLGIIGSNGTGKTTLLKTLLGLISPFSGSLKWNPSLSLGYVPQENQIDTLFPLTVIDLLKMGMAPRLPRFRRLTSVLRKKIQEALDAMEISAKKKNLFGNLSGGEKQRTLLARAWVKHPTVLLMDEPFNSLDHQFKEKLWKFFLKGKTDFGLTLALIDHDLNRIVNHVDYMIVLGPRGTLCGPIHQVITPENLSHAYGAPIHVHSEEDQLQVHFL